MAIYDKDWTVGVKIWTEISEERLAGNFAALSAMVASETSEAQTKQATAVLAVVKANAYGHGIDPCAAILARAGAEWLGVTDAHEGAKVRRVLAEAGIAPERQPEVLVMCGTAGLPGEAQTIIANRLTAVVWSFEQIGVMAEAAKAAGADGPVKVHLEVDTGMTRQGVTPGFWLTRMLEVIGGERGLEMTGLLTHFASTEVAGSPQTRRQRKRFEDAVEQVRESGLKPQWIHVGNSSFIDNATAGTDNAASGSDNAASGGSALPWLRTVARRLDARAMVRSGLGLYGYLLPIVMEGPGRAHSLARTRISPVMTWKTRVIGVSFVTAGSEVGYNGTFIAMTPMRVALLAVGYADGLRRELSSTNAGPGGWVMIRGKRAPIVGRISMNLTTVDVTSIESVSVGDEVLLLGEGITADDHARLAGTIAYEILCGVRTSS